MGLHVWRPFEGQGRDAAADAGGARSGSVALHEVQVDVEAPPAAADADAVGEAPPAAAAPRLRQRPPTPKLAARRRRRR